MYWVLYFENLVILWLPNWLDMLCAAREGFSHKCKCAAGYKSTSQTVIKYFIWYEYTVNKTMFLLWSTLGDWFYVCVHCRNNIWSVNWSSGCPKFRWQTSPSPFLDNVIQKIDLENQTKVKFEIAILLSIHNHLNRQCEVFWKRCSKNTQTLTYY